MRQVKILIHLLRASVVIGFYLGFLKFEDHSSRVITISLLSLLVVNMLEYGAIKMLISSTELVPIKHKKNWLKRIGRFIGPVFLLGTLYISEVTSLLIGHQTIIALLLVNGLAEFVFETVRGDFYLDRKGLIQPELFKRNYNWSQIRNVSLTNDKFSFPLEKDYVEVKISEKTYRQLLELREQIPVNERLF